VRIDSDLYSTPLHTIPIQWISAAEIVTSIYNKIYHVHRLDMSTSGILLFARSEYSCNQFSSLFRDRVIVKKYYAEVLGHMEEDEFSIDVAMRSDIDNRPRQIVDADGGKESRTLGRVVHRRSKMVDSIAVNTSIVELRPLTGRTHQLRVHMAYKGYPILGDDLYSNELAIRASSDNKLHLHAYHLEFEHPYENKSFAITSKCWFYGDDEDAVIVGEISKDIASSSLETSSKKRGASKLYKDGSDDEED
jgi:tRNA pseudouridine32 synthase / 23S rRNA pseudouridine746 synthase